LSADSKILETKIVLQGAKNAVDKKTQCISAVSILISKVLGINEVSLGILTKTGLVEPITISINYKKSYKDLIKQVAKKLNTIETKRHSNLFFGNKNYDFLNSIITFSDDGLTTKEINKILQSNHIPFLLTTNKLDSTASTT
jgi:hypothetical protein